MPDPNRPTPGRRPNQGALVVILAALMLVNLATVGVLVAGGWFDGADAVDEVQQLTQAEPGSDNTPRPIQPDRAVDTTAVRDEAVTRATPATDEPTRPQPGVLPTLEDTSADEPGEATRVLPQVAGQTPEQTPVTQPAPATSPLQFFGLPVFE